MGGKVFFVVCGCFFSKWGKLCTIDVYSHKKLIAALAPYPGNSTKKYIVPHFPM